MRLTARASEEAVAKTKQAEEKAKHAEKRAEEADAELERSNKSPGQIEKFIYGCVYVYIHVLCSIYSTYSRDRLLGTTPEKIVISLTRHSNSRTFFRTCP